MPPGFSLPLARRCQLSSGTGGHPLFRVLRLSRRSGLHVARALVLHDEDPTSQPRMSTPVPRGASSSPRGGHHLCHYQGCAPRMPLSWGCGTRSWMPAEYSHALVLGEKYGPLLMDRSALLQVLRHPARDHIDAHPVQCVWLSDLWVPSICTTHLGVMLRSVEASVQGHLSERRRPKHQKRSGPVRR